MPKPAAGSRRSLDVLVCGLKQQRLGREIGEALSREGFRVQTLTGCLPRDTFLNLLSDAKAAVLLPHATEGFYPPALEAMALHTLVICPDCVGNRSFCRGGENCFMPEYSSEALADAARHALRLPPGDRRALLEAGAETAARHTLAEERQRFFEVLHNIDALWAQCRRS